MKSLRKILLCTFLIVFTVSILIGVSGCKDKAKETEEAVEEAVEETEEAVEEAVEETEEAEEELIIAYLAGVQDPFMILIQKGAEAKAAEFDGVSVVTQIPETWSVDIQTPMWKALANRGDIDLILGVPVDKEALIPVLKDINDRGIPIITCDTSIGDGDYTEGPDSFVLSAISTDNIAAGELAGHALAELLDEEGKVYLCEFAVGVSTSDERSQGFKNAIAEYPKIEIVTSSSCDNDPDIAQTQTIAALKANPEINGVFGNNLFACMGVATGVHNAGLSGAVKVIGFDVTPGVADMIEDGWMDAAAQQMPYMIGYTALEQAVKYLREGIAPPKLIQIDGALITTENIMDPEIQEIIYQ